MTAPAVTYTFSSGTTAVAAQVNTNFTDLVTYLSQRNSGSAAWEVLNVTATSSNPVTITSDQATTEVAINNTAADGDPVLTFKLTGSQLYGIGVDDSDSDFLKFSTTTMTTNVAMQIPTAGAQVQFADGSVGAPCIANIGDTDSGIYFSADNTVAVAASGSQVAIFNGNGFTVAAGFCATPNGTAANPTHTFSADTDLGLYRSGANVLSVSAGNTQVTDFATTQVQFRVDVVPNGAGNQNLGNGSDYWNDVSYKTLTDRGCLGYFDDGVELQDGRIVSDCEALMAIRPAPGKKTIYGSPMLDYTTFPKVSYKKEDKGEDGIEMTSMFSIMIGATRELHRRLSVLEGANATAS